MNKLERMLLLPLTAAAAVAGVVEGIIIYNKMAKVKVAEAALNEMEKEVEPESEAETEAEAETEVEAETEAESE
jgi:cell division protein FtsL